MRIEAGLRLRPILDVAISGFYAWVVTVAVPLHQTGTSGWPVGFAALSVLALLVTAGLVATRWQPWSAISAAMFVVAAASVWFLIAPFEATLGALGSIGWASFAIGWVRAAETEMVTDGKAAHRIDLLPRHRMPRSTWVLLGLCLASVVLLLVMAWSVEGRERALLAHAIAVLGALSLLTSAAMPASSVGRQAAARSVSMGLFVRVLGLGGLVALGCWLTFFRSS